MAVRQGQANGSGWLARAKGMIDNFALAVSHGLIMLAVWLLLRRPDLDREPGPKDQAPPGAGQGGEAPGA